MKDETYELAGEYISTVGDKPENCFGKQFDDKLADSGNTNEIQTLLVDRQ